jgi:hypothetical protein
VAAGNTQAKFQAVAGDFRMHRAAGGILLQIKKVLAAEGEQVEVAGILSLARLKTLTLPTAARWAPSLSRKREREFGDMIA